MNQKWPDNLPENDSYSENNFIGSETICNNEDETNYATPNFEGTKFLSDCNLSDHISLLSKTLCRIPQLLPSQYSLYFYQSLGFQFQNLFERNKLPPLYKMVDTISMVCKKEIVPRIPTIPWFMRMAELKQEPDESLGRFLTRTYEILNSLLSSEELTNGHKEFVDIILVNRMLQGTHSSVSSVLYHFFRKIERFPIANNELSVFQLGVNALYEYQDKLKIGPNYNYPKEEACKFGVSCQNPECLYFHEVKLRWTLTLANLKQDNEDLLMFTHRVRNILEDHQKSNDPRFHEAMDVMAALSMLTGANSRHQHEIHNRFLNWYNNKLSQNGPSIFEKCKEIVLQYDNELFTKNQVIPKAVTKSQKKNKKRYLNSYKRK